MSTPVNIALLGLGTVGSGVVTILQRHADRIARRAGRPIHVRRVVVRDPRKPRDVSLPDGVLTDDLNSILRDPEIDIAVELIGGLEPARAIVLDLLAAGKNIVTANKALLCEHGDELFHAARERGRTICFEAAVAGGIPIIAAVGQSLAANQIRSIEAILNGTSNYILTAMLSQGRSYGDALREAQQLGYAEADPTMDVDGTDAAQKLALLARLAFGTRVPLSDFPRQGIDTLELADLRYADELGYRVKLLAVARLVRGRLEMHVQPTLVHRDRPLAKVDGAFNIIALEGDAVGTAWFSGAGAGRMPTASAVVADLIDTVAGRAALTFPRLDLWDQQPPLPVQPADAIRHRYYLRFNAEDRPHVFADIADILGRHGISLASVIQHEAPEHEAAETGDPVALPTVPVVVMTHRTTAGQLRTAETELDRLDSLRPPRIRMPVAD